MAESYKFFYSFNVLVENEKRFVEYMNNYGNPIMSKYCKNWRLFKQKKILTGESIPEYIGYFDIENLEQFLNSKPPVEMLETIEQAALVSSDIKEWLGKEIASNV